MCVWLVRMDLDDIFCARACRTPLYLTRTACVYMRPLSLCLSLSLSLSLFLSLALLFLPCRPPSHPCHVVPVPRPMPLVADPSKLQSFTAPVLVLDTMLYVGVKHDDVSENDIFAIKLGDIRCALPHIYNNLRYFYGIPLPDNRNCVIKQKM